MDCTHQVLLGKALCDLDEVKAEMALLKIDNYRINKHRDEVEAERDALRASQKITQACNVRQDLRAEKAVAALRQIAAWSWDSGSTPAPEVVSRIYCEARAVLRDTAPEEKP